VGEKIKMIQKDVKHNSKKKWSKDQHNSNEKQEMSRSQGTATNITKESQWSKRPNIWQDAHLLTFP